MVETDYKVDQAVGSDPKWDFTPAYRSISQEFNIGISVTLFLSIQNHASGTYDAGRPWEIDSETFEVITPVGYLDAWKPMLPSFTPAMNFLTLCMTSAHPAYDARENDLYG